MRKGLIIATMLMTAGLLMLGGMSAALAADRTPAGTVMGTRPPIPAPSIIVTTPRAGSVIHRGDWMVVSWRVTEELMADPRFEVKLLKGRPHTLVATLPSGGRIDPPRTFQAGWRVPNTITRGANYFIQVKHRATGKRGFSKLFFME